MSTAEPVLSIVIVSWNAAKHLERCLGALIPELAELPSEIIVVDNASTDGSEELVRDQFSQVKLICNPQNLGFAKANNIGIRESKGKYLGLLNSDIEVRVDCFKGMLQFMEENPRVGMCAPRILNPDGTLQLSCFSLPTLWNMLCRALALDSLFPNSRLFGSRMMTFFAHDTIRSVEMLNGCFLLVRRQALEQVGLLDENFYFYGEDIDWAKRFGDAGWDIVFFPEAEAIHYGGASSSNSPIRFYVEMYRTFLQYWLKHHGKFETSAFLGISVLHQLIRLPPLFALYVVDPQNRPDTLFKVKRAAAVLRWLIKNQKLGA